MDQLAKLRSWAAGLPVVGRVFSSPALPNESAALGAGTTERGDRTTPEDRTRYIYRGFWCDPELRATILDIRALEHRDGRVKRIHGRISRDVTKGGLIFTQPGGNDRISREWDDFSRRLQLNRPAKLKSDARGMVMEGNLALQWVLDNQANVVSAIRMPAETIVPQVTESGVFEDVTRAYVQVDPTGRKEIAAFPLWQLCVVRLDPDNFDDMGSLGRPFLDASRTKLRQLLMTEEDLVIRRRMRAPLRLAHVLEGASDTELDQYRRESEAVQGEITTDYYLNRKGAVTGIQGDANLDQIADVVHLLDSFFAGTPLPKGLMGYTNDMQRDILEDLKRDYYEEVDNLQDELAFAYAQGFRLHLYLKGINADAEDFTIRFAERRTETQTQTTDRGLKLKALGLPEGMVWEELGFDPAYVRKRREWEAKNYDPYPEPDNIGPPPKPTVKVTPGNGRKGESATSVTN